MWLIPFTEGETHKVQIDFGRKIELSGLRLWNYNKSPEDTYRGVRSSSQNETSIPFNPDLTIVTHFLLAYLFQTFLVYSLFNIHSLALFPRNLILVALCLLETEEIWKYLFIQFRHEWCRLVWTVVSSPPTRWIPHPEGSRKLFLRLCSRLDVRSIGSCNNEIGARERKQ